MMLKKLLISSSLLFTSHVFSQDLPKLTETEIKLLKTLNPSDNFNKHFYIPIHIYNLASINLQRWAVTQNCSEKIGFNTKMIPSKNLSKIIDAIALSRASNFNDLNLNANYPYVFGAILANSTLTNEDKANLFAIHEKFSKEIDVIQFITWLQSLEDTVINQMTGDDDYFIVSRAIHFAKILGIWDFIKPDDISEISALEAIPNSPQENYANKDIIVKFIKKFQDDKYILELSNRAASIRALYAFDVHNVLEKVDDFRVSFSKSTGHLSAEKLCEQHPSLCSHQERLKQLEKAIITVFNNTDLSSANGFNFSNYFNQDCSFTQQANKFIQK